MTRQPVIVRRAFPLLRAFPRMLDTTNILPADYHSPRFPFVFVLFRRFTDFRAGERDRRLILLPVVNVLRRKTLAK
jgi:hypothetical protein